MSSSTSSSDASPAEAAKSGAKGARLFLGAMAAGLVAAAAIATVLPEDWIHTAPEFGMADAYNDRTEAACAAKSAPELLILGDSRAVAGLSAQAIAAAGVNVEKFALGASGIFAGWATLDRLIDCGVRPAHVVMAYGPVHILDTGAMMDRTTNFDLLQGPRAGHAYDMAAEWEGSKVRSLAYKAIAVAGTGLTLVDLVLLRPALRNVLEKPPVAISNHATNAAERESFLANAGDRFYGQASGTAELPDEKKYEPHQSVPRVNIEATRAIAALGAAHGFGVSFYTLPVSEIAMAKLPPQLFVTADKFISELEGLGVRPMNRVWTLPDADFGDPSHVNARGRDRISADFLARLSASQLTVIGRAGEAHDAVSFTAKEIEQDRQ